MERPDLSSYLFPLLIKSVRVLNSFPIQFSMINRRSEPALSSIFIGLLSYSKFPLNPLKDRLKSKLVGSSGLEPPTSRLSGARSNQLSYEPIWNRVGNLPPPSRVVFRLPLKLVEDWSRTARGGDDGIRTHDPLLAGQVLSQLSYTPVCLYPSSLLFK